MFCNKCGHENADGATFCNNCGERIIAVAVETVAKEENSTVKSLVNYNRKKNMSTALILNIIAFVMPVVYSFMMNFADATGEVAGGSSSSSGGTTVEVSAAPEMSEIGIGIAIGVGALIFVLGLVIYFLKNQKAKRALSVIYLCTAIGDLILFLASTMLYILASCGLGIIIYVPGILQVVAGAKFFSATRSYEEG